jgi:hypothetical protein
MKVNRVLIAFVVICLIAPIAYLFSNNQADKQAVKEDMLWI